MTDMSNPPKAPRGGAPVGHLRDLDPIEAAAVLYFRMWCEGRSVRDRLASDFLSSLGPRYGHDALSAFDGLCDVCVRYGRRPLMRHALDCSCLGADESCFANLIVLAGEGEREDAALMASLIVRPDLALQTADMAEQVALSFRRMLHSAEHFSSTSRHVH